MKKSFFVLVSVMVLGLALVQAQPRAVKGAFMAAKQLSKTTMLATAAAQSCINYQRQQRDLSHMLQTNQRLQIDPQRTQIKTTVSVPSALKSSGLCPAEKLKKQIAGTSPALESIGLSPFMGNYDIYVPDTSRNSIDSTLQWKNN